MSGPDLADDVAEVCSRLRRLPVICMDRLNVTAKAADILKRQQQRIAELEQQSQFYYKFYYDLWDEVDDANEKLEQRIAETFPNPNEKLKQRITELEGENDDLHSKLRALAPEDYP